MSHQPTSRQAAGPGRSPCGRCRSTCPTALYGIHIGSGQKLTLFNGDRAWDLSGLERWVNWSDNGGDVETVFSKDDLRRTYRGRR